MTALFAALIFVATFSIKLPLSVTGYVHLGDTFILLACVFLPMPYAVLASGLGSALADVLGGYVAYAPITFVVKCLMALTFALFFKIGKNWTNIVGAIFAAIVMSAGYFAYEAILYGLPVATPNILFNLIQGGVCAVIAEPSAYMLKKWWYKPLKADKNKAITVDKQ